jgi:hypothetical protein
MKRIISCLLTLSILASTSINAQKRYYPHEINVGYGYYTTTQMFSALTMAFVTVGSLGTLQMKNPSMIGSFSASYGYHFNKVVALRATIGADASTWDAYRKQDLNATTTAIDCGKLSFTGAFVGAELEIDYLYTQWVKLYGYVGIAATLNWFSYNPNTEGQLLGYQQNNGFFPFVNGQATPIGISVGKQFGGFAELGLGYNGLVRAGLYYKL